MENIDNFLEETTDKPVAKEKLVSWFSLSLVLVGVFIALPAFITGAKMGLGMGFYQSTKAFFLGGLILGIIASCCAVVGAKTRLTTYVIIQHVFGRKGALLVNSSFGLISFGWFGVNAAVFGEAIFGFAGDIESVFNAESLYTVIGTILVIVTAIFGFKALTKIANFAVPLLVVALIALVAISLKKAGFSSITMSSPETISSGSAISIVVGSLIGGAIVSPDTSRYTLSYKHAIVAVLIAFSLIFPLVLTSAAIPALVTGESEITKVITALKIGSIALVVIMFVAWTTNASNIYTSSLCLSTVFAGLKYWQWVLISGFLGTLLAVSGIMDGFIPFLLLLGISMPPVGGIYVVHFMMFGKSDYEEANIYKKPAVCYRALVSWLVSCLVGYFTLHKYFILTTIPAVDSLLVASGFYFILKNCISERARKSGISIIKTIRSQGKYE